MTIWAVNAISIWPMSECMTATCRRKKNTHKCVAHCLFYLHVKLTVKKWNRWYFFLSFLPKTYAHMTREIVRRTYLCARRYIFIRTACLPHIFIFYCLFSSWFVFVLLHTERTQHIELRDHLETIFFTVCSTDVWHIFFLLLLILY